MFVVCVCVELPWICSQKIVVAMVLCAASGVVLNACLYVWEFLFPHYFLHMYGYELRHATAAISL